MADGPPRGLAGARATGRGQPVGLRIDLGQELHPLQRAFIAGAAFQCGICTPGILVAAKALLAKNPSPSDEELRYWLAGNLCRCTGYDKIIAAVQVAAAEMRGA
jgi:carbon-monoxide dehydrogenase small subunit